MTKTHGLSGTRLHRIWKGMRRRCNAPTARAYDRYGGRGITVCPEWDDFMAFRGWALAHGYADDLTIERVDNDQGYSPDNCIWADVATQNRNSRQVLWLTAFGETKKLVEWADDPRCQVSLKILRQRVRVQGFTPEDAITWPLHKKPYRPTAVAS